MGVKISHAKLNELGTTSGGQPGDQMGGQALNPSTGPLEVVTENWYMTPDNPWTAVLRPPVNMRTPMVQLALAIVNNNNVGYDQPRRDTLRQQLVAHNFDVTQIGVCDCDCSSFIRCLCIYAGTDPGNIYTANEYSALVAIGFTPYTTAEYLNTPDNLIKGDVLLKNGHTAIVTSTDADPQFLVWMRWTFYESGYPYDSPQALSIMGGVGNGGYGQYGFHYMYGGLIGIMQYCVNHNPTLYADFNPYIALGNGNEQLRNNTALHNLFIYYAYNYTADFAWCQDTYVLINYIQPVLALAQQNNVPNLDNPYIRGALASFAIRNGVPGSVTADAITAMSASSNVETQLRAGYAVFYNHYSYEGDRYIYELNECLSDMANGINVYDLYTDSPAPPLPPTPTDKGMPVWMMLRRKIFRG